MSSITIAALAEFLGANANQANGQLWAAMELLRKHHSPPKRGPSRDARQTIPEDGIDPEMGLPFVRSARLVRKCDQLIGRCEWR